VTSDPVAEVEQVDGAAGDAEGEEIFRAPALLRILWADPQNMAEHLALWSLKYFGPRARSAVDRLTSSHADARLEDLEREVVQHQTRVCMSEGAFVGGPFIVFIPVAFCAALLAQAQMAFELAAVNGYSPTDRMRAADLLVLQGAYPSTDAAGAALTALTQPPEDAGPKRLPPGTRWNMIKRMAYLLGVLGSTDRDQSRLVGAYHVALLGVTLVVGFVLPLVWVPYMAVSMRRSALRMGKRGIAFYTERQSAEAGVTVARAPAPTITVGISAALIRMVVLIVIPIVAAAIALLTGTDIGGGRWLTAFFALLLFSALLTLAWLGFRWLRYQRRRPAATPA
jgi:hypothetical protein